MSRCRTRGSCVVVPFFGEIGSVIIANGCWLQKLRCALTSDWNFAGRISSGFRESAVFFILASLPSLTNKTTSMPELINANPTVLLASAIPSRASKSSPDPFQELVVSQVAPEDLDDIDQDDKPENFDAQEIYGILPSNAKTYNQIC